MAACGGLCCRTWCKQLVASDAARSLDRLNMARRDEVVRIKFRTFLHARNSLWANLKAPCQFVIANQLYSQDEWVFMHRAIINHQLIHVNLALMDRYAAALENQLMVEKTERFADRFEKLRGDTSYQALSDALYIRANVRISPQAMHKWSKGGAITPENLRIVAEFFGVREAWLLMGESSEQDDASLKKLVDALPGDNGQQVLDFIRYKIERSDPAIIANETMSHYLSLIDGIQRDLTERRKKGHQ